MLRKLKIKTLHGEINTPAFLPDATYGAVNSLSFADVASTKTEELVTTTLHLEEKLGSDYIKEFGGLHKFFNWDRPILTDSGGFQVFSLIHRNGSKDNYLTDKGAHFKNPENGKLAVLTPESSQQIQAKLGSDIRVVLDEPLSLAATAEANEESVVRTTAWAQRSRAEFLKLHELADLSGAVEEVGASRPLLTAVVQGAGDFAMRKRSAEELIDQGFDGYNFGGLPLKPDGKLDLELSEYLVSLLPEDKIRYAMGIGTPDDIIALAELGWDLFDCVLPTRNARHGYLFVPLGEGDVDHKHYSVLHLKTQRYANSHEPIASNTHPALKNISRAYLRHLLRINESAGFRLATLHNLWFYQQVCAGLRS
jgi:queuine tRNA-ribosyltransferase